MLSLDYFMINVRCQASYQYNQIRANIRLSVIHYSSHLVIIELSMIIRDLAGLKAKRSE